jgi:hypothetical protein
VIEQLLQADRLLTVDQVDKARDMYALVAQLDPRNAMAVVGLARCALADGDDRGAYVLAAEALHIDPENDMARRMEARLAEILADRGERVERAASGELTTPQPSAPPASMGASPASAAAPARRSILERLLGR